MRQIVLERPGSLVSGNSVDNEGGGLTNELATLNINSSTVSGNTTSDVGGGVFNYAGEVNIADSTFDGNAATTA